MIRALVPLPVVVPMIAAALVSAIRPFVPRWTAAALFTLGAAFNVWCTAMLFAATTHAPLPALVALLVSTLTLFASIQSWQLKPAASHLEPLMLLFMAAMCGFVYAGDLFNLFVWFELMSASAFALCGLKTAEPAPLQGA